MHTHFQQFQFAAFVLLAGAIIGCGNSDLGSVNGTVRLGGQPLENALVTFTPVAGGRPAAGKTDSSGYYELVFSRDDEGALIGEHTVSISTMGEKVAADGESSELIPEKVPAKYNVNTELKKTVEGGSNTIDFDLEPGGEIVQLME